MPPLPRPEIGDVIQKGIQRRERGVQNKHSVHDSLIVGPVGCGCHFHRRLKAVLFKNKTPGF